MLLKNLAMPSIPSLGDETVYSKPVFLPTAIEVLSSGATIVPGDKFLSMEQINAGVDSVYEVQLKNVAFYCMEDTYKRPHGTTNKSMVMTTKARAEDNQKSYITLYDVRNHVTQHK